MTASARLVMTRGPGPGQTLSLDKDFISLGRAPDNDIVINHPQVSRQHARITRRGGVMVIEDLGSTNSTFVDGTRLSGPHALTDGDVIGLGEAVMLTYHGAGAAVTQKFVMPPPAGWSPAALPPASHHTTPLPPLRSAQPSTYVAAPSPPPLPPPAAPQAEEKKRQTRPWLRCGCLALLLMIAACAGMFALDYIGLLPPIFYEPLRWLGLL